MYKFVPLRSCLLIQLHVHCLSNKLCLPLQLNFELLCVASLAASPHSWRRSEKSKGYHYRFQGLLPSPIAVNTELMVVGRWGKQMDTTEAKDIHTILRPNESISISYSLVLK
jgi:hypothetical protein